MTFGHSGDLGDVIFALPAVRALGGGEIVLHAHPVTQSRMTKGRAESLIPLLEAQPYVTSARYTDEKNPKVDVDFNGFRVRFRPHVTLAQMQAEWVGVKVDLSQPWLERPAVPEVDIVVLSRSPRYRNNQFNWRHVVETLGEQVCFRRNARRAPGFRDALRLRAPLSDRRIFSISRKSLPPVGRSLAISLRRTLSQRE
jgi:hypothetical protein